MQSSNSPLASQAASLEVARQREIIEAGIERLINLLDQLDAPFEDVEDEALDEPSEGFREKDSQYKVAWTDKYDHAD